MFEGLSCIFHGDALDTGPSAGQLANAISRQPEQADSGRPAPVWDDVWPWEWHQWQSAVAFFLMRISEQPSFSAEAAERALPIVMRIVQAAFSSVTKAQAAKALVRAVQATGYDVPVDSAIVPELAALLQNRSNADGRQTAAMALMSLARYRNLGAPIVDVALPHLVSMMSDRRESGRQYAAGAIANLAGQASLRSRISQAALPALTKCLQGEGSQTRMFAAIALGLLTERAELAQPIAQAALADLVRQMQETGDIVRRSDATLLMGHLACNATLKGPICKVALGALVGCLDQPECSTSAAWALRILAASQQLRPAIVQTAVPGLLALLEDSRAAAGRTHAAHAIGNLSMGGRLCVSAILQCIPALQCMAQDAADDTSKHAAQAALQIINDAQHKDGKHIKRSLA